MRLPSLAGLTAATRAVFARFPESLLAGIVAAVAASVSIRDNAELPGALWAAAGLGISLFFCAAMLSERLRPERVGRFDGVRLGLDAGALAALVALGLAWPSWGDPIRLHRLLQFALATHLLASFAPFVVRHDPNAFWQWNRSLFERFVVGGIFSVVLFGGLAVALAAAKPLFGLRLPERTFFDLWLGVVFVFQTGYLLAGVPRDAAALAADRGYPLLLKVFAQLLLVPLVALYLVILSAYLVKVLITGQWPNGWIGWLVSSVSAAGLLALLLVQPVRDREENRWVATFARWFFVALLPSVGMLFAAIGKRVGQYGFTEERYDLFALAAWVAAIAVGYSLRRRADIRWIPITLCALAVVTAFGPWGAYGVSRADQGRRLLAALRQVGLPPDGPVARPDRELTFDERKRLSDAITYLAGAHGLRSLPPMLRAAADADTTFRRLDARNRRDGGTAAAAVMRGLGVGYVDRWQKADNRWFAFQTDPAAPRLEDIAGFDRVLRVNEFLETPRVLADLGCTLALDRRTRSLALTDGEGHRWEFPLDSLVRARQRFGSPSAWPPERIPVRIEATSDGAPARLVVLGLQGTVQGDTLLNVRLDGEIYLGRARARAGQQR